MKYSKKTASRICLILNSAFLILNFSGCGNDSAIQEVSDVTVTTELTKEKTAEITEITTETTTEQNESTTELRTESSSSLLTHNSSLSTTTETAETVIQEFQEEETEEVEEETKAEQDEPAPELPTQNSEPICTLSVDCLTILDNIDNLDPDKVDIVPSDGYIIQPCDVEFSEGESAFDVLKRVCMENRVHMEFSTTPVYNTAYIEGIGNIYEFDCGSLSGWSYSVNGSFPNYGCSLYQLSDGDSVEFRYTCDLGDDIGGGYVGG